MFTKSCYERDYRIGDLEEASYEQLVTLTAEDIVSPRTKLVGAREPDVESA